MLETLLCCILLLAFVFVCIETANLVADKTHLQRVAREAAREAVIDMDTARGKTRGQTVARMYFDDRANLVQLNVNLSQKMQGAAVVYFAKATASYPYKSNILGKEVGLNAQATFGWLDAQ
jgi:Flp pilus assembly protein TadG